MNEPSWMTPPPPRYGYSVAIGFLLGIIVCCTIIVVDRFVHKNEYEGRWVPIDNQAHSTEKTYDL